MSRSYTPRRRSLKRSYINMRSNQISDRGPSIGQWNGSPIYEWIRIAGRPTVKFEYAGLAPSPLPGTLFDPIRTVLTLVIEPGLAYEAAPVS